MEAANGRAVVSSHSWSEAASVQAEVRANTCAAMWLDECDKELTLLGEIGGIEFKCRVDLISHRLGFADLKTTRDVSPFAFGRDAAKLHYDVRLGVYAELVRQNYEGFSQCAIIAVQKPRGGQAIDCAVYEVETPILNQGLDRACHLVRQYKGCLETGEWPGVSGGKDYLPMRWPDYIQPTADWGSA